MLKATKIFIVSLFQELEGYVRVNPISGQATAAFLVNRRPSPREPRPIAQIRDIDLTTLRLHKDWHPAKSGVDLALISVRPSKSSQPSDYIN